ncbi:MAG: hypothetical protein RMN25_12440, partial [Anaerolineae bacterium]|nr:hypothetical protein [Thermoflexales bacterium]MDW8408579.1 hypothetical protein [Anaerolineae bacterium]
MHISHHPQAAGAIFLSRLVSFVIRLVGVAALLAQPIGALLASPVQAAPSLSRAPTTPARVMPDTFTALPTWFESVSDPSWQAGSSEASAAPELLSTDFVLPAWFSEASPADRYRPLDGQNGDDDHHTIYPDRITVTLPAQINNCDVVTVTIVAANDAVTTTNVIVTSTMPTGFTPASQTFVVGTVAPNAVITLTAVYTASCSAVSGQHQLTLSQDGYPLITRLTNFIVNPGALTVRKEPAVISAKVGDIVTWTVYVENTGYGVISNVRVTDTLNSGLQYVSGITSVTYISIPVGETRSFQVSARVVSCADLDNDVVATWGCNLCQVNSAQASVDLIVNNPELVFTPPSIVVPYCAASTTISMPIRNVGDGAANFVRINVNLAPLSVTNVSSGALYVTSPVPGFVLSNPIPAGGVYTLTFDVSFANACGVSGGGSLVYEPTYYDQCGNLFSIPARFGQWSRGPGGASLSVSKSMPREIQLGDVVTATIVVQAADVSGTVRVTDIIPPGWSVINPAGGVVTSSAGITQIVWTGVTGTGTTTFTVVLQSPLTQTNVCALCGTAAVNVVQASAADCQSCAVTASSSATTQIQCNLGIGSQKTVAPASNESCSPYVYTNTFDFPASFPVSATWASMRLTESLANAQAYVTGTLNVLVVNGGVTYTVPASASLIAGQLVITFSDSITVPVPGSWLIVRYQLQTTAASQSPCADYEWYDWTEFNIGVNSGGLCGATGVIREGVYVNSEAPRMSVSISGAPPIVSSCGIYTYTLTVRRESNVPAFDARLDVPTNTYAILEVIGFGNITPISVTSDSLGYHFYYGDAFTTGVTATVQVRVQLRCGSSGPFQANVFYDNRCANDDTPNATCSAGGALANPVTLSPRLILYKFPELIYANGDVVTWTLTTINSGAGIAHGVTLTDVLGSGLRYESSTITSTYGSAAGVTPITSTNLVTWAGLTILPGEKYTIQYAARVVGCTDLTNRLYEQVGCLGQACVRVGPVESRVILPPTVLINTNAALTPLGQCLTRTITATVRNGGLLTVYDARITQTLPPGVNYVPGSTQYVTGTGATPPLVGWVPGGEPQVITGSWGIHLVWTTTQIADLQTIPPRSTVFLRFDVTAGCNFVGGNILVQTRYRDVCGESILTNPSNFYMPAIAPEITARKVARNVTTGSPFSGLTYASPGDVVVWQLWLTNTSSSPAFNLVTTDTLPANVVFVSASPAPSGVSGGVITWSVGTLTTTTWTALVTTTVVGGACTITDVQNVFAATWGCDDGCRQGITATASLRTRPVFDPPSFTTDIAPNSLSRCGGLITLTLVNNGPPAWNVYLTDTLPSGYFYQATVFSSTAPSLLPTPGVSVPVWGWTGGISLPTGVTTITFLVNSGLSGVCGAPVSGPNRIDVRYEDDPSCAGSGPYTATSNNTLTVLNPTLVVSKSPVTRFANVGDIVTWTVRVTNTGAAAAPNIVVTDTLGSAFISPTAGNGVYPAGSTAPVISGNIITWTPPFTLAPGQSWVAVVTAVLTASGVFRNEVNVSGNCASGCNYGQSNTTAFVTLFEQFRKGPPVQTGTIGSLVVFTISASLTSQSTDYQNLTLTDTLPAGLGYVASTLVYTYNVPSSPTTLISSTPTISPAYLASGPIVWRLGN